MPARTLATDKDAYVDEGAPDTNFGTSLTLWIRWQSSLAGGNDRRTLMGFPLQGFLDANPEIVDVLGGTLRVQPVDAAAGETVECHDVDEDAWTEEGATWNNQPEAGDLQDTESTSDDPLEWDVDDEVLAAMGDGEQDRVGFVLTMQEGGAAETNDVEHESRQSDGQEAVLELETRESRGEDLASQVLAVIPSERYIGAKSIELLNADGLSIPMPDSCYDPERDKIWGGEDGIDDRVHRWDADGTHDAEFTVTEGGSPLGERPVGFAYHEGKDRLFIAEWGGLGEGNDVLECSIDEENNELVVEDRHAGHGFRADLLGITGDDVWLVGSPDLGTDRLERRDVNTWEFGAATEEGFSEIKAVVCAEGRRNPFVWWAPFGGEFNEVDRANPQIGGAGAVRRWTTPRRHQEDSYKGGFFRGKSFRSPLVLVDSTGDASFMRVMMPGEIGSVVTVKTKATLPSEVMIRSASRRWTTGARESIENAPTGTAQFNGLAWYPERGLWWFGDTFEEDDDGHPVVHLYNRFGEHQDQYNVPEFTNGWPSNGMSGLTMRDGKLWIVEENAFGGDSSVYECLIDDENLELTIDETHTLDEVDVRFHWDPVAEKFWIVDDDGNVKRYSEDLETEEKSWTIDGSISLQGGVMTVDDEPGSVWVCERFDGDLVTSEYDEDGNRQRSLPVPGLSDTGQIAAKGNESSGFLVVQSELSMAWAVSQFLASEVFVRPVKDENLASQVQPGNVPGAQALASEVIADPAKAFLDSLVSVLGDAFLASTVSTGSWKELTSEVTVRVEGLKDLASQARPGGIPREEDLFSQVTPGFQFAGTLHEARVKGSVAPRVIVDEDDLANVSGEVGSEVLVDPGGANEQGIRRVVQILDAATLRYPKTTSDPPIRLHRGDAILYAQAGDEDILHPGAVVEYEDREWVVRSLLGFELVGDVRTYNEVALRRLAVTMQARLVGQPLHAVDLESTVEAAEGG